MYSLWITPLFFVYEIQQIILPVSSCKALSIQPPMHQLSPNKYQSPQPMPVRFDCRTNVSKISIYKFAEIHDWVDERGSK